MSDASTHQLRTEVASAAEDLLAYCAERDFAGYDPYDALNSPLLRMVTLGLKWPRIAVTQAVKKIPWNLRPLLMIPKGHNPKGLGLFLWSYTKLYAVDPKPETLEKIEHVLDLLESVKGTPEHGVGWGYNFPWQSRAFYVPRGTPTIVNTSFVAHALLDTYEITGNERALEMVKPVKGRINARLIKHRIGRFGIHHLARPDRRRAAKDHKVDQRVRPQPVRSVNRRATGFADGHEAGHDGVRIVGGRVQHLAPIVGRNTAHVVVHRW